MKKTICLLLALIMIFSLAACNPDNKTSVNNNLDFEIGDTGGLKVPFGNGETIKMIGTDETNGASKYIYEKLSQITGLNVEPMLIPVSTAQEKIRVLLGSGDLPDVIGAGVGGLSTINELAMQGAFAAVSDHLDEMPNFQRLFGKDSDYNYIFKSCAANDGKLYILPIYEMQRRVNLGMLYRKDIFDKHGLTMWNSPETFYQTLKKLKELYPESYPLSSKQGAALLSSYATAWGIKAYNVYYDEGAKAWKYSDTDPKMKEMLDFFNKLYKEELLDPEFLTNTQPVWTKKMVNGDSFISFDWIGRLDMFVSQSTIPGYDLRYANPVGPNQTIETLPKISNAGTVVAKNDNSALTMKLMDFLYSDAGAELMTCGVRGETFEVDENGKAKYLGFEEGKKIEITDLAEKYGMWVQGTYTRVDKRSCYFNFTEREQEAQDWPEKCKGLEPADPVVNFTGDDVAEVSDISGKLSKKFEEVMFKYIVGTETGDAAWEKWCEQAKKLGSDRLVELYNKRHKELGL